MALKYAETPDEIIVSFTDAKIVGDSRIREIGERLLDVCGRAASAGKRLIVDFRSVQIMSSAMIAKLVLLNKCAKQRKLDLRLANVGRNVHEVFKIVRFGDDGPDLLGAPVPLPKPPGTDSGRAEPPRD